jgi:capsular exopolysaccharide synthesis family protein
LSSPAPQETRDRKSDLEGVVSTLRRRAGLIVLCLVVTTAVAVGFSLLQEKQYSASAALLFRDPGFAQDLFGSSATPPNTDPTRDAATNEKLVGLDVVAARTAAVLKGGLDSEDVSDKIEVAPAGLSDVVTVTATDHSPAQARRIANTFARQFIQVRAQADKSKLLQAQRLAESEFERLSEAEQEGVRGESLSRAAEKLGVLASLQTGNAELVQPAELPTSPSSPKPLRNGLIGALLGLLLGIGLAFLFERLNRSLRDPEDAAEAFDLPVLGVVPESKAIVQSNAGVAADLPFAESESFRMLRASLRYFNVNRDVRSVLVTSSAAQAGKSTVAWNLARVAATSARVVILETDLRNPTLAQQHGLSRGPGLTELLTHQVDLEGATQQKTIAVGGAETQLDVIVSGSVPPNPAGLLESEAMNGVLEQLKARYDLVVVDTAPVGVVSDAFPLLRKVDGVIVVVRLGETSRDAAKRIREQLNRIEAPVLGIVANGVKLKRRQRYGYGYGYYGQQPDPAPAATSSGE